MPNDVLIIGAGPSGLCMACALARTGIAVTVLEQGDADALAAPVDDGREIALTHASRTSLEALGIWRHFKPSEIAPLERALVLDGDDREGLTFDPPERTRAPLGWLVPNHAIRRAAHTEATASEGVTIVGGARVNGLEPGPDSIRVSLEDGRGFEARLAIAADNRFSTCRRAIGIPADHHDFGKVMIVVQVRHEKPHAATAWEWFRYGQTLALLPLHDPNIASAVLTVPTADASAFMALSPDAQGADLARRFDGRLGTMQVATRAFAYPLVGVYARRFVAQRFALVGDAAVGMHPVTAHGFNFGLASVVRLAQLIEDAQRSGSDIAQLHLLARYERGHRRATRPLYAATRLVADLFTDDRLPVRVMRKGALRIATHLPGFRERIANRLIDRDERPRFPFARWIALR
jgi:ubiquinone biosynthesis UbiH/UbiF/VisC/COQ6 family hydroxylase